VSWRKPWTETVRVSDRGSGREVPLTPIQEWFFEQNLPARSYFNQSRVMNAPDDLATGELLELLDAVTRAHDVFRFHYSWAGGRWRQVRGRPNVQLEVRRLPKGQDPLEGVAAIRRGLQDTLHIGTGPLARFCIAESEDQRWCIGVIHHLIVDNVSWLVMQEDLAGGNPIAPPTSFEEWAHTIRDAAKDLDVDAVRESWPTPKREGGAVRSAGCNADENALAVGLGDGVSVPIGQWLRRERIGWHHAILAGVISALASQPDRGLPLSADVETHGRSFPGGKDLSGTVGWCTTLAPFSARVGGNARDVARSVQEHYASWSEVAWTYGAAKYLRGVRDLCPTGELCFNFQGRGPDHTSRGGGWQYVATGAEGDWSVEGARPHGVDVDGHLTGEELHLGISWSKSGGYGDVAELLAQEVPRWLRQLANAVRDTSGTGVRHG